MEEIYRVELAFDKHTLRPGDKLRLIRKAYHSDIKSMTAFPYRWPPLESGAVVIFIESWDNVQGAWIKVHAPNGQTYNVEPYMFDVVKK